MRALVVVLVIVGLYLLLVHVDPLPLNHEQIGLGKVHIAHAVGGVVALAAAAFVWRKSRRRSAATG